MGDTGQPPFEPLQWVAGVYAPHFLRVAGMPEHAQTLEKMRGLGELYINSRSREVQKDVARRHGELSRAGVIAPLPDDDPVLQFLPRTSATMDLWSIAEQAAEIAIGEGQLTLDDFRSARERFADGIRDQLSRP